MYLSTENKKKLVYSSIIMACAAISVMAGRTLANTLILTSYSTNILYYFYFSQSLLLIIITAITANYQQIHLRNSHFLQISISFFTSTMYCSA